MLRQIGGSGALGQYLSAQLSEERSPSIACGCGGELMYQREREASVISVFGRVSIGGDTMPGVSVGKGKRRWIKNWD